MDEKLIATIVDQVVAQMRGRDAVEQSADVVPNQAGVFQSMDQAANAAAEAFQSYRGVSLETRKRIVATIRATAHANKVDWSHRILDETKLGRISHKIRKHELVADMTPGVEDLETRVWSGDKGLTIEECAPFGVFGAVTPVTHPAETMINNSISLLAAGNTVVFNPHPSSKRCFAHAVDLVNRAIEQVSGYRNLITTIAEPTIETGREMFNHPAVRVLLVTGGPAVVREALKSSKKAITAGPGNPPVVVDETADIEAAAGHIITGASFDNNILCIGEKQVFVVESVADALIAALQKQGCVMLNTPQINALAKQAFKCPGEPDAVKSCGHAVLNRELVGRNASVLANTIGLSISDDVPLLIGETNFEHVWVQEEQMMPFLPIVRVRDVDQGIDYAVRSEHGYCHTAVIHSMNVAAMTRMGRAMNCSIFVKNGPSTAGLAGGGEGYASFSIASPTGEGICTARTFSRTLRCTLVDYLRIV